MQITEGVGTEIRECVWRTGSGYRDQGVSRENREWVQRSEIRECVWRTGSGYGEQGVGREIREWVWRTGSG